ncbi:MAG: hypothetical protein KBB32_01015 [Spirochaetia bacterium]|nr:hypothetical protein [Spirochaetia bacterium]
MGGINVTGADLRLSTGAGLGAAVLSATVAAFSRVPLGALVLRAVLLGALFALMTYGAIAVLRRFMPELFEDGQAPADALEREAPGQRVNIVLPGDEAPAVSGPGAESADSAESVATAEGELAGSSGEAPEHIPVLDRVMAAERPERRADDDLADIESDVEAIQAESLIPKNDQPEPVSRPPRPSVALDELDVLPDLDTLSDSFSEVVSDGDQGEEESPIYAPVSGGSDSAAGDPAALAKAVQTLLRRDQKG